MQFIAEPHLCWHSAVNQRLVSNLNRAHRRIWELQHAVHHQRYAPYRKRRPRHRRRRRRSKRTPQSCEVELDAAHAQRLVAGLKTLQDVAALLDLQPEVKEAVLGDDRVRKLCAAAEPARQLCDMVGLQDIKNKVFEMLCYYASLQGTDILHVVIEGPPGVGKTRVAEILGQLLAAVGVLEKGHVVTAKRASLIGEFVGQTAPRTQAVIDSALGGVLLIDEAYSLGHSDQRDPFSKECLDTLNENLTAKKNQFLCIIVGYANELQACFFSANLGLRRRFPITFRIKDYSCAELACILQQQLGEWTMDAADAEVVALVERYFDLLHHFGGDVESWVVQAKFVAAKRLLAQEEPNRSLQIADLDSAAADLFGDRKKKDTNVTNLYYM